LQPKSRARHDDQRAFSDEAQAQLGELLHQSPRHHGYAVSYWTLALLAEVSYQRGWVTQPVHPDTVAATLHRMGFRWKRTKAWISSPDPHYAVKKSDAIG
jgi:transposase